MPERIIHRPIAPLREQRRQVLPPHTFHQTRYEAGNIVDRPEERERRLFRAAFALDAQLQREIDVAIEGGALERIRKNVLSRYDEVMAAWRAEDTTDKFTPPDNDRL